MRVNLIGLNFAPVRGSLTILSSARKGVSLTGASAELNQELGLRSNEIPLELVGSPVETRAVTPAPTTGTGVSKRLLLSNSFMRAQAWLAQLGMCGCNRSIVVR